MRIKTGNKKASRFLLSLCLTGMLTSLAKFSLADDIDAYRAPPAQKTSHNMLFVVDQSGSMNSPRSDPKIAILRRSLIRVLGLPDMIGNKVSIMGYNTNGSRPQLSPMAPFTTLTTTSVSTLRQRVSRLTAGSYTPSGPAIYYGLRWLSSGWNPAARPAGHPRYRLARGAIRQPLASPINAANHCADNRLIFLSDGAPNYGITANTRVSLGTVPASTNSINLLRPPESRYVRDIYNPAYLANRGLFSGRNYGPNLSQLTRRIGSRYLEGVNGRWFSLFSRELDRMAGANRQTLLNDVNRRSAAANLCSPYTNTLFTLTNAFQPANSENRYLSRSQIYRRAGACITEMANFASQVDLRPGADFPKTQTITLDTIGFGVSAGGLQERFLQDVARAGGGTYYPASNQAQLDEAFANIASSVEASVDFAYNAPTIPVDTSDPTAVGSNIFLPLLEPSNKKIWPGNLNKYQYTLSVSTYTATIVNGGITSSVTKQRERIVITGQGNRPAFNSSGSLTANTRDFWASGGAGDDIKTGGIASLIHADTNRQIYTEGSNGNGLRLISAATPNAVNRSGLYAVELNGADLFCNDPYWCAKPRSDKAIYSAWINDQNINTNVEINTLGSKQYARFSSVDLEVNSQRIYPQYIKIHFAKNVAGTPNSFLITIKDQYNQARQTNVAPDSNGIITVALADNNTSQVFDVSKLSIKCGSGYSDCQSNKQLPVAEVEILERPVSGGGSVSDADWFTKIPLTTQQISNSVTKVGAPFHTKPIVVKTGTDKTVYLPTSEGVLHAFDADSGDELWGFMPTQLLPNIGILRNNQDLGSSENPIYGLDGQPYYFTVNNGGTTQHILVFGMRRGGRSYFALDVSNRTSPRLLWKIDSSMPAFKKLGQTWPQAYPAPIKIGGVEKNALVFGGGYDPLSDAKTSHTDNNNKRVPDKVGNRIYFIDALTGEPLIVVTDTSNTTSTGENFGSAKHIKLEGLDFGIVANPAHLDYDQDKYYDRFYFADTGGQIIRVDISDASTGPALKASVMANLGGHGAARFIRFFNPPTVAKQIISGSDVASIVVGSGNRPQLAQKNVVDKLFVIRDDAPYSQIYTKTATLNSLYDVTSNVLQMSTDTTTIATNKTLLANADGWYLNLGDNITTSPYSGEKVINRARVYKDVIYFTTYTMIDQASTVDVCNFVNSKSNSRFYAISLKDGAAVYPEFLDNNDGGVKAVTGDRFLTIKNPGGGIPSEITFYTVRGDTPDAVDLVLSASLGDDAVKIPLRDTLVAKSWEILPD